MSKKNFRSALVSRDAFKRIRPKQSRNSSNEFEGDEASKSLFSACKSGNLKKVERVIRKKPGSVNGSNSAFQNTPLHLASSLGHIDIINTLLKHNANVEAKNYQKRTPLMMACEVANFECVQTLIDHGASIFATDAVASQSPLHYTCAGSGKGGERVKIVKYLIKQGADVSVRDTEMWTALHFAAQKGYNRICKALIAADAPFTAQTKDGATALDLGCRSGGLTVEVMEILSRDEESALSITYIDLSQRGIKIVPSFLERFKNLKQLDIEKNEIESLPQFLLTLSNLTTVNLRGNPLNTIPTVFHNDNWEKIKRYLLTLTEKKSEWRERKLLFVGQEGVGKTTLLRCFTKKRGYRGVNTKSNLSTDGIDIIEGISLAGDTSVLFNAWDLGGQEIYYPSHQFFLTSNSVYILVFDVTKPQYDRIDYWLQLIRSLGSKGFSKILTFIVGTHIDNSICTPEYIKKISDTISSKFPRLRFPGLQQVSFVSCKSGLGIKEFTENVVTIVKKEQFAPILAEPWIKLHEYIRTATTKDFVDWNEFKEWTKICELEPDQISLATEFLVDIGGIIHFDDPRGNLHDLVILNPQWLADVMACLITTRHNFAKDGLLPHNAIRQIFVEYPKKQHEQLLVLLENFSILNPLQRKINNQKCYLVPSLLPETIPSEDIAKYWPTVVPDNFIEYGRVREFSFLPLGLFSRMMIAVLHVEQIKGLVFWRNGMLVKQNEQYGLLIYNPQTFILKFNVRVAIGFRSSRENVSLLREFIEIIETIIGCYYPRLAKTTHRFVTCTHCKELREPSVALDPFLFTEDIVIESIHEGIPALYCHHIKSASRCVSVIDLAPDLAFQDLPAIDSEDLIIDKQLGQGGFGTVYKGSWNGIQVAIKELNATKQVNEGFSSDARAELVSSNQMRKFQEFQRECWIMSTLLHPNITQLYGVSVRPKLRMVMQFCPGGDLFDFLHPKDKDGKRLSITQDQISLKLRYKIGLDIAKGMRYLQSVKPPIIHRDLRSLNVFLIDPREESKLRAQVADFGLSRRVAPKITGFLGTWQWLAPEVIDASSDQYDQRADIYSYGIVFWEVMTAGIPFNEYYFDSRYGRKVGNDDTIDSYEINVIQMKSAIINDHVRPTIPDYVPDIIRDIIKQCWKVNPEERPSFQYIVEVLSKLADEPLYDVDKEVAYFSNKNIHNSVIQENKMPKSKLKVKNIFSLQNTIDCREEEHLDNSAIMTALYHSKTSKIWIGYATGAIGVFNTDGTRIIYLQAHLNRVSYIIKTVHHIWSCGEDGMIYVWSPDTYNVVACWKASQHRNDVVSYLLQIYLPPSLVPSWSSGTLVRSKKIRKDTMNNEGSYTIWSTLPLSRSIRIWDAEHFNLRNTLVVGDTNDTISCLTHCNKMVWVGTRSGKVFLYEAASLDIIGCFNLHSGVQWLITNENRVWSASGNNVQVWEWNDSSLKKLADSSVHSSIVRSINIMPHCKQVWTGSFDGKVIVWDSKKMVPLQELDGPHENTSIRICVEIDNSIFWTIGRNGTVGCWIKK